MRSPRTWVWDQFTNHIEDWKSHPRQILLVLMLLVTNPVSVWRMVSDSPPDFHGLHPEETEPSER